MNMSSPTAVPAQPDVRKLTAPLAVRRIVPAYNAGGSGNRGSAVLA
jgi:hypothetical protein